MFSAIGGGQRTLFAKVSTPNDAPTRLRGAFTLVYPSCSMWVAMECYEMAESDTPAPRDTTRARNKASRASRAKGALGLATWRQSETRATSRIQLPAQLCGQFKPNRGSTR